MTTTQLNENLGKHTLDDVHCFFEGCEDLSFVFVARTDHGKENVSERAPSFVAAADLVIRASLGVQCDTNGAEVGPDVEQRRADIVAAVQARVRELQRREDVSFVLCWNVKGDPEPHLDYSHKWSWAEAKQQLVGFLEHDLNVIVNT
ncbi:MAG: hypothetical protein ACYTG0_26770 [Planctomycetota bacterium]|jgi:hypothetical protein